MKTFIVSWVLVFYTHSNPSPDHDKFGRYLNWRPAIDQVTTNYEPHFQTFKNRDSAVSFFNEANLQKLHGDIINVSIDSTCIDCSMPIDTIFIGTINGKISGKLWNMPTYTFADTANFNIHTRTFLRSYKPKKRHKK